MKFSATSASSAREIAFEFLSVIAVSAVAKKTILTGVTG
jgi:hypothetical protein